MIFIDSNVPMYVVGAPHANKDRAVSVLNELTRTGERLVTSVEVYQEILHRYSAVRRFGALDDAFQSLDAIVDDVLSFGMSEIHAAKTLIETVNGLSARDALHVAVMQSAGVSRILSFDRRFDDCPGIERLS